MRHKAAENKGGEGRRTSVSRSSRPPTPTLLDLLDRMTRWGTDDHARWERYAERLLKYQRGERSHPGEAPPGYEDTFLVHNRYAPRPNDPVRRDVAPPQQAFPQMTGIAQGAPPSGAGEVVMSATAFGQVLAFTENMASRCLAGGEYAGMRAPLYAARPPPPRPPPRYRGGAPPRRNGPAKAGERIPPRSQERTCTHLAVDLNAKRDATRDAKRAAKKERRRAAKLAKRERNVDQDGDEKMGDAEADARAKREADGARGTRDGSEEREGSEAPEAREAPEGRDASKAAQERISDGHTDEEDLEELEDPAKK